jgi:hypothetical protein
MPVATVPQFKIAAKALIKQAAIIIPVNPVSKKPAPTNAVTQMATLAKFKPATNSAINTDTATLPNSASVKKAPVKTEVLSVALATGVAINKQPCD